MNMGTKESTHKVMLKQARAEFTKRWNDPVPTDTSCLEDFDRLKTIGAGGYSKVLLVEHRKDNRLYAMKIMQKQHVMNYVEDSQGIINEKKIMAAIRFPFVMHLNFAFQDNANLYIAMEFAQGGCLFDHQYYNKLTEEHNRFYTGQIVLALEYLHEVDIIYQDLKPENVVICVDGYVKLTDFGLSRIGDSSTNKFLSTYSYMAPEMILHTEYNKAVDWWSFGALLYEVNARRSVFVADDTETLKLMITDGYNGSCPLQFSCELKDLVQNTLRIDIDERYNGTDIKRHAWFESLDWEELFCKNIKPPFVPEVCGPTDTKYLDELNEEEILISSENQYAEQFGEF